MAERHSRKKLDLTGQRFGKLSVLEPAENIGSRTAWRCKCDCGAEIVVKTQQLRSGRQTSCGCDKPDHGGAPGSAGLASLTYIDGTCVEMLRARTVRSNNTSGTPGVDWLAKKQRWRATICFKGKRRYLGSYENFEDAVKARKKAEEDVFDTFLDAHAGKIPASELRSIEEVCPPVVRDYSERKLDLTGQQFGQLTVLEPAEKIGSTLTWKLKVPVDKDVTSTNETPLTITEVNYTVDGFTWTKQSGLDNVNEKSITGTHQIDASTNVPTYSISNYYTKNPTLPPEPNLAVTKTMTKLEDGNVRFDITVENKGDTLYNLMLVDTMDKTLQAIGNMAAVHVSVYDKDSTSDENADSQNPLVTFMGVWEDAEAPVRDANDCIVWTADGGVKRDPNGEDKWDFTWMLGGEFKTGAQLTLTYDAKIIFPDDADSVTYYNYADAIAGTEASDMPKYEGPSAISTFSFVSGGSGPVGGGSSGGGTTGGSGPVGGTEYRYTLTYDFNGGEQDGQSSVKVTQWVSEPYYTFTVDGNVVPARTGYTLNADGPWGNAAENATAIHKAGAKITATKGNQHKTIYAQWTPDPAKIVFEENGGTDVPDRDGVTDQVITDRTMPTTTKDGFDFGGWYDNADFSGEKVTDLPEKFPVGTTTYYAKWVEKTALTIKIVGNNSTVTYNGQEQSVTGYTMTVTDKDGNVIPLPTGLTVTPASNDSVAKGTDASETAYPMGLAAENFSVAGADANKYTVTFNVTDGWLKINPPEKTLDVTAGDVTATYDGKGHPVTPVVTLDGETVTDAVVNVVYTDENNNVITGEPTDAGTYTAKITATKDGKTVQTTATVTINKRTLTVTTDSASKVYNGTALTAPGRIEGLVDGETVTFTVTGTQTEVGSSRNTYTLTWNGIAKERNYTVSVGSIGTLTVTAVVSHTLTVRYVYADGTIAAPNASITRAEFAAIAARFLDQNEYTDDGTGDFSDTANHWAAKEIRLAAKAGWIQGDGNRFRPDDFITRAEVMTIVNRMLDRVPDADHMLETMKKWIDNPEDAWYYEAVQEATNEHAYERDADLGVVETWTEILEVRDWKALEESWADANA